VIAGEVGRDGKRRGLRKHRGAGVAFLFGFVPELMRKSQAERRGDGRLALGLLQAEHVRVGGRDEVAQALAERGADAVDVPGKDLRVTHRQIT
jgi:hypothetical protein